MRNGAYPTHPVWNTIALIVLFEIVVIWVEAVIASRLMAKYNLSVEANMRLFYTMILSNVITFFLGLALQIGWQAGIFG